MAANCYILFYDNNNTGYYNGSNPTMLMYREPLFQSPGTHTSTPSSSIMVNDDLQRWRNVDQGASTAGRSTRRPHTVKRALKSIGNTISNWFSGGNNSSSSSSSNSSSGNNMQQPGRQQQASTIIEQPRFLSDHRHVSSLLNEDQQERNVYEVLTEQEQMLLFEQMFGSVHRSAQEVQSIMSKMLHKKFKANRSDLPDASKLCVICQTEFVEHEPLIVIPKCHHEYHSKCLKQWFFEHDTCPMCRSSID